MNGGSALNPAKNAAMGILASFRAIPAASLKKQKALGPDEGDNSPRLPRRICPVCGESYETEKDPYHLENCREAMRP